MKRKFAGMTRPVLVILGLMCASCRYGLPDDVPASAALLFSLLSSTTNSFTWANQLVSLDLGAQGV